MGFSNIVLQLTLTPVHTDDDQSLVKLNLKEVIQFSQLHPGRPKSYS